MITHPHKIFNFFVQVDPHDGVFITPPVPVPLPIIIGAHAAAGDLSMPLIGLGEKKANDMKLLADGEPVVARGHEPKMFIIPHLSILPPPPVVNVLMPLLIFGSSSKCEFAAGSVRCADGAMAVSVLGGVGLNLSCGDFFSQPTSAVFNSGSVWVGFTFGDLVAGAFCMVFDIAKGAIEGLIFKGLFSPKFFGKMMKGQLLSLFQKTGWLKMLPGRGVRMPGVKPADAKEIWAGFNQLIDGVKGVDGAPDIDGIGVSPLETVFGTVYGRIIGGDWGYKGGKEDDWLNKRFWTSLITGDGITGDGAVADQLGAMIDGRAEYAAPDDLEWPSTATGPVPPLQELPPLQVTEPVSSGGTVTLDPQPLPDLGLGDGDKTKK